MQKHLFDKKPFKKTYVPDGMAKDVDAFVKNMIKLSKTILSTFNY